MHDSAAESWNCRSSLVEMRLNASGSVASDFTVSRNLDFRRFWEGLCTRPVTRGYGECFAFCGDGVLGSMGAAMLCVSGECGGACGGSCCDCCAV